MEESKRKKQDGEEALVAGRETEEAREASPRDGTEEPSARPVGTKNAAAIRSYLSGGEDPRGKRRAERAKKKAAGRSGEKDENGARESGSGLAGRQWKIIAVLAAAVVALVPVYFAVIRPLVTAEKETGSKKEVMTPEKGEVQTESGFLGMMPTLKMEEVQELTLNSENGSWGFSYYEDRDSFYIKDHTEAMYDTSTWTTVFYTFSNAAFSSRAAGGEDINYADYGLSEGDKPASCEIVTRDGDRHTVLVGNSTASGSGYYACYEHNGERRDTVYIVNSTMGQCAKLSMYDVLNPIVTAPLDEKDYVPERFDIYHNGKAFLKIRKLSASEIAQTETAKTNHVFMPNGIEYNTSSAYMTMLYSTLRGGIMGTRVVYHAKDGESVTAAELAEYGIRVPAYYNTDAGSADRTSEGSTAPENMPYMVLSFAKGKAVQELLFSEKTEKGTYYVYVAAFDMIVEVNASSVSFMEWEEKKFIDASIFLSSVYSIKDLTVDSTAVSDQYVAAGVPRVKETFRLTSKLSTAADGSEINVLTNVDVDSLGGPVPAPVDSKDDGPTNFKQLYMVLISIGAQLDVPAEVLENIDLDAPDVTVTVHTVRDQEHILRFYFYNSRHAYYTLDGKGQFYVVYDELTKFLSDTVSLVQGRAVDWETNNNEQVKVDTSTGETTLTIRSRKRMRKTKKRKCLLTLL